MSLYTQKHTLTDLFQPRGGRMTRSAHPECGTKVANSSHQSLGVLAFDLNSHHKRQLSTDTLPSISLVLAHVHFLRLTFCADITPSLCLSGRRLRFIYFLG